MSAKAMSLVESLQVLHGVRRDEIVVTAMGAAREWMKLGSHRLDFNYVPSSMGQATALGLGLAIARPDRQVVVCNGDGSLLMNLGSLVTVTAQGPDNLVLLTFDNGVYEVTGAQRTPAVASCRRGETDLCYTEMVRACGFANVFAFDRLAEWRDRVREVLSAAGPTFALLKVAPIPGAVGPKSPGPAAERARRFAEAVDDSPSEPT